MSKIFQIWCKECNYSTLNRRASSGEDRSVPHAIGITCAYDSQKRYQIYPEARCFSFPLESFHYLIVTVSDESQMLQQALLSL